MPEGLPIDYEQALNGTMAAYAQQLLICTGQRDWTSRIENDGQDQGWGNLVRGLKRLLGRGGPYLDVCRQCMQGICCRHNANSLLFFLALQQCFGHQHLDCTRSKQPVDRLGISLPCLQIHPFNTGGKHTLGR